MSKFLSGRLRRFLVGITGYTENDTVVQTTGKVGIGTTNAQQHSLFVVGSTNITGDTIVGGDLTTVGVATFQSNVFVDQSLYIGGLEITGGASVGEDITARNLNLTGIATVAGLTDLDGDFNVAGVSTFQDTAIFDSTNSIQIPSGTEAEKDPVGVAVTGQIRFNTTNQQFEGFGVGNNWGSLGGVKDVDGDTEIKAELSAGSDEDTLFFYTGGNLSGILSTTSADLNVDLNVDGNVDVTGVSTFQDDVEIEVDKKLRLGTAISALEIYRTSGNYNIIEANQGPLQFNIDTSDVIFSLNRSQTPKDVLKLIDGPNNVTSVELYHDDSKVFETIGAGISVSNGTSDTATIAGPTNLIIDPTVVGDNTGTVRIKGDLYVDGTEFIVNSTTIELTDLKIGIATNVGTNFLLDGGGIGIGSDNIEKTILWNNSNSRMEFNADLYAPNFTTGNLNASTLNISGISTFGGQITAGGTTGTSGQYLESTGIGVTWASFPTLRTTQTTSATNGQTTFNFTYNVNFLDVFVNGVKLTSSEYTATNGTSVVLATPAFENDIVELQSYNIVSTGADEFISKSTLQTVTAASTDFADFQTRIAAL